MNGEDPDGPPVHEDGRPSALEELARAVLGVDRGLDVDAIRFDWHIGGRDFSLGFDRDRPDELVVLIGGDFVSRWRQGAS